MNRTMQREAAAGEITERRGVELDLYHLERQGGYYIPSSPEFHCDLDSIITMNVCWDKNSLTLLWWHWNCFCLSFPEESYSYCLGMKKLISPSKWVHVIRVKKGL